MKTFIKRSLCYLLTLAMLSSFSSPFETGPKEVWASGTEKTGSARIHFLTLTDNTDAILLESNGQFGIVDSGEDNDYPSGKDPRYPLRSGIVIGNGFEEEVISYMHSVGVTRDNLEFYIGTHAHSDHIGSADEIIHEFHPKRVYIEPYSDSDITSNTNLWDNLYTYDKMITAAKETGATLIQTFDESAPLYPETVTVRGNILWQPEDLTSDTEIAPESISVTLEYKAESSTVNLPAPITVNALKSSEHENLWTYEMKGIQKYDESKTPYEYSIAPKSEGYEFVSAGEENPYDFLCGRTPAVTPPESIPDLPENGGIEEEKPVPAAELPASDNLFTSDIPTDDQVDPGHPDDPMNANRDEEAPPAQSGLYEDESGGVSTPVFYLGGADGMKLEIMNYGVARPQPDANYFSLGVKVTAVNTGKTAFLAGDINNYLGAENVLAKVLGHVNVLKLGHHGFYGSNTNTYLKTLNPDIAILTGKYNYVSNKTMGDEIGTLDALLSLGSRGTPLYPTAWYNEYVDALVINLDKTLSNNIPKGKGFVASAERITPYQNIYYYDGIPTPYNGWVQSTNGKRYFFENSYRASCSKWLKDSSGKWFYLRDDGTMAVGWLKADGYWYYMDSNGHAVTEWQQLDNKWYYFGADGRMVTGEKQIGLHYYYFDSSGVMAADQYVNGYYYDSSGKWVPNFKDSSWKKDQNGWWYQFKDGTYPKNVWLKIHGTWYFFHPSGYLATGWFKQGNSWYYLGNEGNLHTGWYRVKGIWYYSDASGVMQTGWLKSGSSRYYLNPSSGAMHTGWLLENGKWYYFAPSSGAMTTGWQKVNSKWYYMDSNGIMQTGWVKSGGRWYYLTPSSGAMAANGWVSDSGKWYYVNADGVMVTGWLKLSGKWYYLAPGSGEMKTGWVKSGSKWYYLHHGSGIMASGWIHVNNKWYYLNSDGAMATGWLKLSGKWYYLTPGSGEMLSSTWTPDGYYVNASGEWTGQTR